MIKKHFRITLLVMLFCAVFCISAAVQASGSVSSPRGSGSVMYDCVWFGTYLQAEVVDSEATIDASVGTAYMDASDYIVDAQLYENLASSSAWDGGNNLVLDGNTYHRMRATDAAYRTTTAGYYQWNDTSTYHYFKYMPIKWRVLQVNGNQALLLADECLDNVAYNPSSSAVTWENCAMRSWLNSTFISNAFTGAEQAAILPTTCVNGKNSTYNTSGGNDTVDQVFLLSEADVCNKNYGFGENANLYDASRRADSSTYAKAMGLWWSVDANYSGNAFWWLRTPGKYGWNADYVSNSGFISRIGYATNRMGYAVRPALTLDLNSSAYIYAGTVSNDGSVLEVNAACAHHYTETTTKATLDKNGVIELKCSLCGDVKKSETIDHPSSFAFAHAEEVYTGNDICPALTIKDTKGKVIPSDSYDVAYSNNLRAGQAQAAVTFKGNYEGSKSISFNIVYPEGFGGAPDYEIPVWTDLESEHNYANNMNKTWVYDAYSSDISSLEVTFDARTQLEADYDYIYLLDQNNRVVGQYTHWQLAGKTIKVPGKVVQIRLMSDIANATWGFKVTSIKANREVPETETESETETETETETESETESQTQETESQTPETESQAPETESQTQETESQAPETESQTPETESKEPETESKAPETESKVPDTEESDLNTPGTVPPPIISYTPSPVVKPLATPVNRTTIKLTWTAPDDTVRPDGYIIYAKRGEKGSFAYLGMTTVNMYYNDIRAIDTDYNYYRIYAYRNDPQGKRCLSSTEIIKGWYKCEAVTNLKAANMVGGVKLTWTASKNAEGYLIYGIHGDQKKGATYGYIGMTTKGTTYTDTRALKTDWNFYWVFSELFKKGTLNRVQGH